MGVVLPREHGTWMMFFLPFLFGMLLAGPELIHLPLLIGWFFIYLFSTPFLAIIRKPSTRQLKPLLVTYGSLAALFIVPLAWFKPLLLLIAVLFIPLLIINIYFIKKKNERSLWNNLSGIIIFSLGGVAAFIIKTDNWSADATFILLWNTFYFMGSAFYVKSLIRERKNRLFKLQSHVYHTLLFIIPWLLSTPWMSVAYVPSILKDWFTSRKKPIKPLVTGIIEIINGLIFLVISILVLN
ncbi:YwiC-like family protein [Halalkalibacter urbisdiaboli]|uniref:YwiC-like family protein n=1 Tax=Halalkalibacter urbisdiaboli TaxID=1960589 RepID=UPI000B4378EB|nr:YwiC-like family protein [Halalkalibacter urbisdiaboli]